MFNKIRLKEILSEYKKVFTKEIKEYFIKFKPNYILMLITSATYVALLYNYGIKNTFIANLDLIKFMILTPMLLSVNCSLSAPPVTFIVSPN